MNQISNLTNRLKQKSSETTETIETALQKDLKLLHDSFVTSLSESETTIKKGTENLDIETAKFKTRLEEYQKEIDTLFTTHITSVRTLTEKKLAAQKAEIETLMKKYSDELKGVMELHQARAFDFIELRSWVVVIVCSLIVFLVLILGLLIGMKLG